MSCDTKATRFFEEFTDEFELIVVNASFENECKANKILERVKPGLYDVELVSAVMVSKVFSDDVWVCKTWFPTRRDALYHEA